jgi:hypothetical protein
MLIIYFLNINSIKSFFYVFILQVRISYYVINVRSLV